MILELIYTSARRGLRPKGSGFQTVAHTRGMPPTLIEFVERLSAYRFLFSPSGPEAGLNPTIRSHVVVALGGQRYHVLSRIATSGADYSGRANHLAHHIIVPVGECPPAGPAWVVAQESLFVEHWNEEPRLLEPRGTLPTADLYPTACSYWREVTGDAGWAGEMVRLVRADAAKPVFLVCDPRLDALRLLAEVCLLLHPLERWRITFSTALTGSPPPGVNCQLRVVIGVPAARQAAAIPPHAKVFDLTGSIGPCPESPEAAAARDGLLIDPPSNLIAVNLPRPEPGEAAESGKRFKSTRRETNAGRVGVLQPGLAQQVGAFGVEEDPIEWPGGVAETHRFDTERSRRSTPRRALRAALQGLVVVMLMLAAFVWGMQLNRKESSANAPRVAAVDPSDTLKESAPSGLESATLRDRSSEGTIPGHATMSGPEDQDTLTATDDTSEARLGEIARLKKDIDDRDSIITSLESEKRELEHQLNSCESNRDTEDDKPADTASEQRKSVAPAGQSFTDPGHEIKWQQIESRVQPTRWDDLILREFGEADTIRIPKSWAQEVNGQLVLKWQLGIGISNTRNSLIPDITDRLKADNTDLTAVVLDNGFIQITKSNGSIIQPGVAIVHPAEARASASQLCFLARPNEPQVQGALKLLECKLVRDGDRSKWVVPKVFEDLCGWRAQNFQESQLVIDQQNDFAGRAQIHLMQKQGSSNPTALELDFDLTVSGCYFEVDKIIKKLQHLKAMLDGADWEGGVGSNNVIGGPRSVVSDVKDGMQDLVSDLRSCMDRLCALFEPSDGVLAIFNKRGELVIRLEWPGWNAAAAPVEGAP